jgi:hypothetical protein
MMFRFLLVVAVLLVHGELRAEPSEAEKHGFAPKFIIYNAKGPADSCGPGCDRWIAAEGEVDGEAAARVRRFLSEVKDPKRPIYFHSPGGVVEQSYVIGRLLRSRKAVARIGKTVVTACAAGTQVDAARPAAARSRLNFRPAMRCAIRPAAICFSAPRRARLRPMRWWACTIPG